MFITIWRHGEAGSAATDRLRELTPRGREELALGSHRFLALCESKSLAVPDVILHSPWVRTTQTADLLAAALLTVRSSISEALQPGKTPADVDLALEQRCAEHNSEHVLLVSHQPLVSTLVDYYLDAPGRVAPVLPGGLATLELSAFGRGCGLLKFALQPPGYEDAA